MNQPWLPMPSKETSAVALSVSEVNARAHRLLETQIGWLSVQGELSGVKCVNGNWYMSLRDEQSVLSGVMYRRDVSALRFVLKDGLHVTARGRLGVYSARGQYQLMIDAVQLQGQGALQQAFDMLKVRLEAEGLFAASRKRPLPFLPKRVAVVTSPEGAVIRDICNVATRRFPGANILVFPTRVQGVESASNIAQAIGLACAQAHARELSVIIVARGGGSFEDLCGFNDERVARAIVASPVPVVSAVGHETDFTIADFVADLRAPTPSAAAELVFPVRDELIAACQHTLLRAAQGLRRHMRQGEQSLSWAMEKLHGVMQKSLTQRHRLLQQYEMRMVRLHPKNQTASMRHRVNTVSIRLVSAQRALVARLRARFDKNTSRLQSLSPLAVLDRGYSIITDASGHVVRSPEDVRMNQDLTARMAHGHLGVRVTSLDVDAGPV